MLRLKRKGDEFVITHDLIKKIKNGMYDETLKRCLCG